MIWACLRYSNSSKREKMKIPGFKRLCLLYTFPAMLPNWALFAIHENIVTDPNQPYLSRPFSPHAIRVNCAQITRSAQAGQLPQTEKTPNKAD